MWNRKCMNTNKKWEVKCNLSSFSSHTTLRQDDTRYGTTRYSILLLNHFMSLRAHKSYFLSLVSQSDLLLCLSFDCHWTNVEQWRTEANDTEHWRHDTLGIGQACASAIIVWRVFFEVFCFYRWQCKRCITQHTIDENKLEFDDCSTGETFVWHFSNESLLFVIGVCRCVFVNWIHFKASNWIKIVGDWLSSFGNWWFGCTKSLRKWWALCWRRSEATNKLKHWSHRCMLSEHLN